MRLIGPDYNTDLAGVFSYHESYSCPSDLSDFYVYADDWVYGEDISVTCVESSIPMIDAALWIIFSLLRC